MLAAILLALAAGIVGHGLATGGGFSARIARLAGRTSRPRMIVGWAIGTAITYSASAIAALALLGRIGAVAKAPTEVRDAAWRLGLPAAIDGAGLAWLGLAMVGGVLAGVAILLLRRRTGGRPIGLRYRSPAAMRRPGEWPAALALAVSAGVGEELFFRLLLPLLVALVFGSAAAGFAVSLAAFTALHRHQGPAGMVAVALVGAALTYLYLLTGMLWVAMLVHVAIDGNALVLRPWLTPSVSAATPS